jgi:hypothetical protein
VCALRRESRKKKELVLNYRLAVFLSIMFTGMVFLAEGLVKTLARLYADETLWYLVIGSAFTICGLLIARGLSEDLRKFFKKG